MDFTLENYIDFLCKRFGVKIGEEEYESSFSDLGIDSLSIFAVVSDIESHFNIKVSSTDLFSLNSPLKFYTAVAGDVAMGKKYDYST